MGNTGAELLSLGRYAEMGLLQLLTVKQLPKIQSQHCSLGACHTVTCQSYPMLREVHPHLLMWFGRFGPALKSA